jgi:hypothetical protein
MKDSSARRVAKPAQKQLIQTLEPRRLMSLTAAFDFPPPADPPGGFAQLQFNRAFEQSAPDFSPPDFHSDDPVTFALPAPGTPLFQLSDQDGQAFPTREEVVSISSTAGAPTAAVSTAEPTATTLSAIYSTLDHSTVAQIDAAAEKSLASSLDSAPQTQTPSTVTAQSLATSQPAYIQTTVLKINDASIAGHENVNIAAVTSDAALAQALSVAVPPVAIATPLTLPAVTQDTAPSWTSLRKLEDDLISVRAFANQIVSELGRDCAISLSHLGSLIETSPLTAISGNSATAWRSLAVTGAIIAGVAYAQSKTETDKQKTKAVFSNHMIEIVPA